MSMDWNGGGVPAVEVWEQVGAGIRVATVSSADVVDGLTVTLPGPAANPVPARSTVEVAPTDVGRSALIVFEEADPVRPIIVGLIRENPLVVEVQGKLPVAPATPLRDVSVDGKRIEIEAGEVLELRCGKASITLRKDGKLVIKGMEILSWARGTHRVKGATVQIN